MATTTESQTGITSIDSRSTIATDPLRVFRFKATFTPVGGATGSLSAHTFAKFTGGFNGIQGLRTSIDAIDYREGGYNTTMHKVPGMATFMPIVFSRGAIWGNDVAINWMRTLFAVSSGEGIVGSQNSGFRCNIKIEVMDHPNTTSSTNIPKMAFYVQNAWISSLSYSDLNAGASEIMFESITVQHEGLSILQIDEKGNGIGVATAPTWI